MKKMMLILAACTIGFAANASDWRSQVDVNSADLSKFTMVMINAGKEAGGMTYGWHKEGDTYVVADRSEMQPNILETAKGVIDAKTLLPKSVVIDFAMGDDKMDFDFSWDKNKRTGTVKTLRGGKANTHNIDTAEEFGAPLRLAVIGMVAAFPVTETFEANLPWFNTLANKVEMITLKATGSETVEAPAGTFDTYKVAIQGGTPENVVYVTKSLPRKIVRIDVVGQPMHFLRNKDS
ncbi:MAG: hypothetical protein AB3N28_07850 [Kordiimonas sp.]